MQGFLFTVLAVIVGTFIGVSIYQWLKAEWDERQWRRILKEEMADVDRLPRYRLVVDADGERE